VQRRGTGRRRLENVKLFVGLPAAISVTLLLIAKGCEFIGGELPIGPGQKLGRHVQESDVKHQVYDSISRSHIRRDSIQDENIKEQAQLNEAQALGECLENPCTLVIRQKLLRFCLRNGITRCQNYGDTL
jgi:hypothetical protein